MPSLGQVVSLFHGSCQLPSSIFISFQFSVISPPTPFPIHLVSLEVRHALAEEARVEEFLSATCRLSEVEFLSFPLHTCNFGAAPMGIS